MLFKKLILSLVVALSIINPIAAYAITLIPGGDSIGIELDYQGVVITGGYEVKTTDGTYNPLENEFKIGDKIIEIEGKKVTAINELSEIIKNSGNLKENFDVTVIRNNKEIHKTLKSFMKITNLLLVYMSKMQLMVLEPLLFIILISKVLEH